MTDEFRMRYWLGVVRGTRNGFWFMLGQTDADRAKRRAMHRGLRLAKDAGLYGGSVHSEEKLDEMDAWSIERFE